MKMQSKALVEKLNRLKGVASNSKSDTSFNGILLEQSTIMASSPMYSLRLKTDETVDEPIIIPTAAVDLISNMPDSEIDLSIAGRNLTVKSGNIRATFATRPADEYPRIQSHDDAAVIVLDWPKFREAITRVSFACAKTHANVALQGVHVFTNENGLNVTACDSFRLAWDYIDASADSSIDVVISREAVAKLVNAFDGETVKLSLSKAYARFEDESAEFSIRLIDSPYPDMTKIIPSYENVCEINVALFTAMLHRVAPLCSQLAIDASGSVAAISGRFEGGIGDINDAISLDTPLKAPVRISFNTSYLRDAFKAFDTPTVQVGFDAGPSAGVKPMILKAGTVLMLTVPVRV